nr:sperm-associated antigen 11-like [Camelus dromedarius]XP_031296226.1 sperm-associated antigen 11-like [Camelus dromedarius]
MRPLLISVPETYKRPRSVPSSLRTGGRAGLRGPETMKALFLLAVLCGLVQTNSGDVPPGIRNIVCLSQHGTCRLFFCHSGEKKADICSDPWNRCCLPNTEGTRKEKPETDDGPST